jgi:hypothetical protein
MGASHGIFFRDHLSSLGIDQSVETPIFSDSASTLLAVENTSSLKNALHLVRRTYFMRMAKIEGEITFYRVVGKENPADVLTKYLTAPYFLAAVAYFLGMEVNYNN